AAAADARQRPVAVRTGARAAVRKEARMSTPRQIVAIKGRRSGAGVAARLMRIGAVLAMVLAFAGFVAPADAQTAPAAAQAQAQMQPAAAPAASTPLPSVNVGNIGGEPVSMPLQVLLLMTAITLLPAALLGLTAFPRRSEERRLGHDCRSRGAPYQQEQ